MPTRPTPNQRQFAKHLRTHQTDCEQLLWQQLRSRQIANLKFRRQVPCPPYILDFYCVEKKLAIELDGGQHYDPLHITYDQRRTHYLHQQGIQLLRFSNLQILQQMNAVLEQILHTVTPAAASAQTPRPHPGRAK
ncbi:endonuclease domain-containing protein [Pseudomonas mucidolens]|uniref:endonuclease domain-containing protein n=1 Tax=Pseudomonas mucidolens TaxID=46679 RepID=UPI0030DC8585